MNELKPIIQNNQIYVESRQVADMVEKQHGHLLRDIKNYIDTLNQAKIGFVEFFIESTYTDSKGEKRPCYLLSQKGCEFVANKMTGEKGTLFTAKYINLFHEMKEKLKPSYMIDDPIARAEKWIEEQKHLKALELEKQLVQKQLEYKDDVIIGLTKDVDLATKQQRINDIVRHAPVSKIQDRWKLLYKEFDKAYRINSKERHQNAIERGEIKKTVNRLTFICKNLNLTNELYRVCVKLFESDARMMFENILDLI